MSSWLEGVEDGDHALIFDLVRAFDHHCRIGVVRLERRQLVLELRQRHRLVVERDLAVRVNRDAA